MERDFVNYYYSQNIGIEMVLSNMSVCSYPLHNHVSTYTLGVVRKGEITIGDDKKQETIHTGEAFLFKPYQPHSISCSAPYSMITLCISKKFIESKNISSIKRIFLERLVKIAKLTPNEVSIIFHAIDNIFNDDFQGTFQSNDILYEGLKAFMEDAPENDISLNQLSQHAYMSKYQFIRDFKNTVGLTPHQFQIQNRIRKAQKLCTTNLTLTKVALTTGFYDQSHFIRLFKRIVGVTPSAYKNLCFDLKEIEPIPPKDN